MAREAVKTAPSSPAITYNKVSTEQAAPETRGRSAFYTGRPAFALGARRKTSKLSKKFDRCVKAVRKTVRARKGSNKESAAIAICTKTVLQPRGKTMKRYRKGRLTTQKAFD